MYLSLVILECAIAAIAVAAVSQIAYYRYLHALSPFPGPFWASFSRLWLVYHTAKGDEAEVCFELHKKHGPVIRISPTLVDVSEAHLLPLIYHRDADKTPHDAPMVADAPESLFTLSDHKAHARARRMIGRPYTPSAVARLEPLVDEHVEHWLSRLAGLHASGLAFDLAPWCSYMSFDVLSSLAFGAALGFTAAGADVSGLIHGLHTGWLGFGALQRLHPLKAWLSSNRLFRRLLVPSPDRAPRSGFGVLLRERDRLIDARLAAMRAAGGGWAGRPDMLAAILAARDDAGAPLPLGVVRMEVMSILVAGADTTGTTLQSFLVDLLRRPAALARCRAEVRRAAAAWPAGPPSAAQVRAACPFFEACLRETMRLRPAAPNFMPRLVGPAGLVLPCGRGRADVRLPPGLEVTANIWVVGRDPAVYGDDAGDWVPERWLVGGAVDEARVREWARFSLTWGAGARMCLGRDIAWMELVKAGAEVLRRFELCRAGGEERWVVKGGVGWWEDVRVRIEHAGEAE